MAQIKTRSDRIIGFLSFLMVATFAAMVAFGVPQQAQAQDQEPPRDNSISVILELKSGEVMLELWPDVAPNHVERITGLVEEEFYHGIVFHRVIEGFMAQTGDPTGTGTGGSNYPDLAAEFSDESFKRGVLGMARSSNPDSANSQFFIMFDDASHLDGKYTVFGRVASGMELIDALKRGEGSGGMVDGPDAIISMRLAQ